MRTPPRRGGPSPAPGAGIPAAAARPRRSIAMATDAIVHRHTNRIRQRGGHMRQHRRAGGAVRCRPPSRRATSSPSGASWGGRNTGRFIRRAVPQEAGTVYRIHLARTTRSRRRPCIPARARRRAPCARSPGLRPDPGPDADIAAPTRDRRDGATGRAPPAAGIRGAGRGGGGCRPPVAGAGPIGRRPRRDVGLPRAPSHRHCPIGCRTFCCLRGSAATGHLGAGSSRGAIRASAGPSARCAVQAEPDLRRKACHLSPACAAPRSIGGFRTSAAQPAFWRCTCAHIARRCGRSKPTCR